MNSDQVQTGIADLVAAAKRLRTARAACRQFLALWALQQASEQLPPADEQLADPANHDWSILYRGNILDD